MARSAVGEFIRKRLDELDLSVRALSDRLGHESWTQVNNVTADPPRGQVPRGAAKQWADALELSQDAALRFYRLILIDNGMGMYVEAMDQLRDRYRILRNRHLNAMRQIAELTGALPPDDEADDDSTEIAGPGL